MARKTKLTDKEWQVIGNRMAAGESVRALSREFGVPESTIRTRLSAQSKTVANLVNTMVSAEVAIKQLPISAQVSAHNLAAQLRSISMSLTSGAAKGAMLYDHFQTVAIARSKKVSADGELDEDAVKQVAGLMRVANIGAEVPMQMVKITKELAEAGIDEKDANAPISTITVRVVDAKS